MTLPVSLKAAAGEIDACPQELAAYVNKATGELVLIPSNAGLFGGDLEVWEEDIERVESSDDFIKLPSNSGRDDYEVMERFCHSQDDGRIRDALLDAISGKGAFGRFRDKISHLGVRQQWFDYKEREIARMARDFLAEHDIAFVDDVGLGPSDST